jgi:DNA replication and repair protein RecF
VAARVIVESLRVRNLRIIAELELEPAPRLNVIAGDNGQGKTTLLEAIYFVATSKSFRTEKAQELLQEGAEHATVQVVIDEAGQSRKQTAVLGPRTRSLLIDGKRAARLGSYATRTPVVVFHPGDLTLVSGAAAGRRRLLDRIALYTRPGSMDARMRFEKALRERQRALEQRGLQAAELDAYEELAARYGAELSRDRSEAAQNLSEALAPAFERIAAPELSLACAYRPGGSQDPSAFRLELAQRRGLDLRRGSASFGPQKDELALAIAGRSAQKHASQGQQRVLTLALKAAELECVRAARRVDPVLLLDDISSELDPTRIGAVHQFVKSLGSQVFVTTTRPELFSTPEIQAPERADWRMQSGRLHRSDT